MKEAFFPITFVLLLLLCALVQCWGMPARNELVEMQYQPDQPNRSEGADNGDQSTAFLNAEPDVDFPQDEVDEETISKAEKIADEDLLNGLNEILKNNETLEDVLRAESISDLG